VRYKLQIDRKIRYAEGQRMFPLQYTLERLSSPSVLSAVGITELADITSLDRVGIPVVSASRPAAQKGAVSVHSGKGTSLEQAKVSAIMEGAERCLAERREDRGYLQKGSHAEMSESWHALDPVQLIPSERVDESTTLEWMKGSGLISGGEVLVPANAVLHPYNPEQDTHRLFRSNTNGLAAGCVLEDAIVHGLLEVLERDAISLAEYTKHTGEVVHISEGDGMPHTLMKMFEGAGVSCHLWRLPSHRGVHTMVAALDDTTLKDASLLVMGAGAHLSPSIAATRALCEAAQSRVVQIHGVREDTIIHREVAHSIGYERMKRLNRHWYADGKVQELSELDDNSSESPSKNIDLILSGIDVDEVAVVDLSIQKLNISVVRVVIPGFEMYNIDESRVGSRARAYREAV